MKTIQKQTFSLLLILGILLSFALHASAEVSDAALADAVTDMAQYICKTVPAPQVGSTGGEWAVLGLARSGCSVPEEYYRSYYAAVEAYVRACGGQLHDKKYTEYSRVIVALSAIGKDARDVAGYDLTKPLGDYEKTIWQGLNGPVWALIALDSAGYPMPENPEAETQATRQMYIDRILSCRLADGGWSLSGSVSDPDITGMALQALAKYQDQPAVKTATQEALECMSLLQNSQGGFGSWDSKNSESCVQMLVALCELGISPDDARFVKNGNTIVDALMDFYTPGSGFLHTGGDGGSGLMASEQGLYGLAAALRFRQGKNSLYRMDDAVSISESWSGRSDAGLDGKHADVKSVPVTVPGKTFSDVSGHDARPAIEAMAERGILSGRDDGLFHPDESMTRAEFAAVVVRALGLTPKAGGSFTDVSAGSWYASYVGTASDYGIITGTGSGKFEPNGTITRQEAAVMVSRAAALCGLSTEPDAAATRDILAQFGDYVQTAEWARPSLAFCYDSGILDNSALNIDAGGIISRCEIAHMLYNLLSIAKLL